MSIQQEIKELRGKVENLIRIVKILSETNTNNESVMTNAIFKIKQGEAFISPATISGGIISQAQGELKTTPDGIEVVKDGVTCCRMHRA